MQNGNQQQTEKGQNKLRFNREPMVDLPTAAAFFSISDDTLRRLISRKKIRSYRLGVKLIRVRLSEVEADLTKMRRRGRPKLKEQLAQGRS
jgi:excisionase family DNA binding protein